MLACTVVYQAPYRHVRASVSQGSVISPALFNYFMSDPPLTDYDMASYADDFTIMASSPKVDEAVVKANRLMKTLVEWAGRKELSIAPHKSSVTLFTPDTHQSHLHPKVKIGDDVIPLNRTPKILGVTWYTHLTFAAHARDIIAQGVPAALGSARRWQAPTGDLTKRHWFTRTRPSPGLY